MDKFRFRILTLGAVLLLNSCHVGRYFKWNLADIRDHKKFPYLTVEKSNQLFEFNKLDEFTMPTISYENQYLELSHFLEDKKLKNVAFIIIRNDTILLEKYWRGYNQGSLIPSFSVTKSFVSALIGIAIEEGKIKSVDDQVITYLPEMSDSGESIKKLTIEDLLDMRSGLDFNEYRYLNPFKGVSKLYYGLDHGKYALKTKPKQEPAKNFRYQSINSQLLGLILERATGVSPAKYLEQKIWKPAGMKYNATWSVDSKKNQNIKAFCCLNSTAIDLAKFGRLYLMKGNWNGTQLVPGAWVNRSVTPTPPNKGYQYNWYSINRPQYFEDSLAAELNRKTKEFAEQSIRYPGKYFIRRRGPAYAASGLLGQYIYVDPSKNLVIVRLGKKKGNISWWQVFEQISEVL